jgi:hypothetical protein
MTHTIEIFSAGCPVCREARDLVQRVAGPSDQVLVREMQHDDTANRARALGIRSLPAVVVDGRLASCCAGQGPDERTLREALQ